MDNSNSPNQSLEGNLSNALEKNLVFHVLIEKEVQEIQFGQITFNFKLVKGEVKLDTLNIVRNRRVRY